MNATSNPARMTARNKKGVAPQSQQANAVAAQIQRETSDKPAQETGSNELRTVLLQFKPRSGPFFNSGRAVAAQKAGFGWSKKGISSLAVLDEDTGEDLAVMRTHGGREAIGQLSLVEVEMDTENCPIGYWSGKRVIGACVQFADNFDASVCDAAGNPLSTEDLEALSQAIDAKLNARRKAAFRESTRQRELQPDGTYRRVDHLSFVASYETKRERCIRYCYFDVQPMSYEEGEVEGMRLAKEMLNFLCDHKMRLLPVSCILEDAISLGEPDYRGKSKSNVARSFIRVVSDMLVFAARNANYSDWIDALIKKTDAENSALERLAAEKKAAFVERMRAARLAKRTAIAKPQPTSARRAPAARPQRELEAA